MRPQSIFLILLWAIPVFGSCSFNKPSPGKQVLVTDGLSGKVIDGYWLYLPKTYTPEKKWPVILFLQGGDGASPNPRSSKEAGPAKYALSNSQNLTLAKYVSDTFIIINPHMRAGPLAKRQWFQYSETLVDIMDHVSNEYSADSNRYYLTGLSRGGHGSWGLIKRYPDKFAAVVPISGAISCKSGCEDITNIPIWIIHNQGDKTVDINHASKTVEHFEEAFGKQFLKVSSVSPNLKKLDPNYIFSNLTEEGHDAWTAAYSSTVIYEWLLNRKLDGSD